MRCNHVNCSVRHQFDMYYVLYQYIQLELVQSLNWKYTAAMSDDFKISVVRNCDGRFDLAVSLDFGTIGSRPLV